MIILTILKIIALILLAILAVFIALVVTALVSPIKYDAYGGLHEVQATVTWFFKLLKIKFRYEKEVLSYKVYILFFSVFDTSPDKPHKRKFSILELIAKPFRFFGRFIKKKTTKSVAVSQPAGNEHSVGSKSTKAQGDTAGEKPKQERTEPTRLETTAIKPAQEQPRTEKQKNAEQLKNSEKQKYVEKQNHVEKQKKDDGEENAKKRKFSIKDTLRFTEKIWNYEDRSAIVHETMRFLKKEYHVIKPDVLEIHGIFGLDDPAAVGAILGVISILNGICGDFIKVHGDFENKTIDLFVQLKGSLVLFSVLWAFIRYILAKPILKIVKIGLRKRKERKHRQSKRQELKT